MSPLDLPTQNCDIHNDTTLTFPCSENGTLHSVLGAFSCPPGWEHVACDLCGGDNPFLWLKKDGFHYVRCPRCGLVYVTPRLQDHLFQQDKFYQVVTGGNWEAAAEQDQNPRRMRSLIQAARNYLPYKRNGNLLDVGCGIRLIDRNGGRQVPPFFLRKLTRRTVKYAERTLDLAARITLRGHRMRIMAEKAA